MSCMDKQREWRVGWPLVSSQMACVAHTASLHPGDQENPAEPSNKETEATSVKPVTKKHWKKSTVPTRPQRRVITLQLVSLYISYCIAADMKKTQPLTYFPDLEWNKEWEWTKGEARVWKKGWREGILFVKVLKRPLVHTFMERTKNVIVSKCSWPGLYALSFSKIWQDVF